MWTAPTPKHTQNTGQNLARTMPDLQTGTLSDRDYAHGEHFEEIGGDA